jgi:hypothetical protein
VETREHLAQTHQTRIDADDPSLAMCRTDPRTCAPRPAGPAGSGLPPLPSCRWFAVAVSDTGATPTSNAGALFLYTSNSSS